MPATPSSAGRYDLVTIFEALHDMNHPVQVLRATRTMLAEHGSVVIRAETLCAYAREAGFRHVKVLPIEHESWRFYQLTP